MNAIVARLVTDDHGQDLCRIRHRVRADRGSRRCRGGCDRAGRGLAVEPGSERHRQRRVMSRSMNRFR
jgi:hypothetical protein